MKYLVLSFLFLITSAQTFSDSISANQSDQTEYYQSKIDQLESQIQVTEKYLDRITNTVYWSLSVLAVIAGLLVGFGWFSNFKVYQRDKIALREEIESFLNTEIEKQNSVISGIKSGVKTIVKKETASVHEKILAESELQINNKMDEVKSEINTIKGSISYLKGRIQELKLEGLEHERKYWELKPVPSVELTTCIRILKLSNKINKDYMISSSLDRIKTLINNNVDIYHSDEAELIEISDSLPNKYSEAVATLKQILRDRNSKNS